MRRDTSGLSLPEVLVATAIVGLLLALVCSVFSYSLQAYRSGEDSALAFRNTALGLEKMRREAQLWEALYSPENPETLKEGYTPELGHRAPLVVRMRPEATAPPVTVAYTWDSQARAVVRSLYDPGSTGGSAWTPSWQVLVPGVRGFKVSYQRQGRAEILKFEMQAPPQGQPVGTKVRPLGAYSLPGEGATAP